MAGKSSKKPAPPANADWREEALARMRALILEADPEMIEERKWKKPSNGIGGVPVWSHNGIVCTGETYAKAVKLTINKFLCKPNPMSKKETCGADASASFNRADFGINYGQPYGFDMGVSLQIQVEAIKAD